MSLILVDKAALEALIGFADRRFNNAEITTDAYLAVPEAIKLGKKAIEDPTRPAIAADITGGVLQGFSSNVEADLFCLDYEDYDPSTCGDIDGDDAHIMSISGAVDPEFIRKVSKAYDAVCALENAGTPS